MGYESGWRVKAKAPNGEVRAEHPVLLHIPHASTLIPDDLRPQFGLSDEELEREATTMTDLYTDDLFDLPDVDRLVFPVSRLVVDPERFEDDVEEPMSMAGMGAVYEKTNDGRVLRQPIDRDKLIDRYYRPHHAALTSWASSALEKFGACLIVDCHSFPSSPLPCDRDQSLGRPEICIGTEEFHTPNSLWDAAVALFTASGSKVEVDRPYSGSIVPNSFLGKEPRVESVMFEVGRDLYLDGSTGAPSAGYTVTKKRLLDALKSVIQVWESIP